MVPDPFGHGGCDALSLYAEGRHKLKNINRSNYKMKNRLKVLMVDDEKRFRDTTRKILERKGFETILAENGPQAIENLGRKPDVVILDIKMPGMDGHEVLARIQDLCPGLPVIMLTGHGDRPSAEQARGQGAYDYLSKPCDIDLLSDRIRAACRGNSKPDESREVPVAAVMIPIKAYTVIEETRTVTQAVIELKTSFVTLMATNRIMETGHRSVLVTDSHGRITGALTIRDLLEAVMPGYLTSPKPATADSIQYSPMFWKGMFSSGIRAIRSMPVGEVMSPSPAVIDARSSLMAAAYSMVKENQRRLIVERDGKPVGVVREQDLFFEMEKCLKNGN